MAGKFNVKDAPKKTAKQYLMSWEGGLVLIFIGVLIFGRVFAGAPFTFSNVMRAMPKYLAELFMMYAMGFILVIAEIDISVGAIVCLAGTVTCFANIAGLPLILQIIICIGVGCLCGCLNGVIMTHFQELPAMIVTLGTQIIFRGIAEVAMGSGGSVSLKDTSGFAKIGGMVGPIPIAFFLVAVTAVIFILVLSRTTAGRKMYAIGSNPVAAKYAGIPVQKIRFICFMLVGTMAGVCALFLLATSFGANTTTGNGFEMDVIAMCVFGGIATTGGKGNLIGATIAGFTIICLRIALGLKNVNGQLILVIIGLLLLISVLIPAINSAITSKRKKAAAAKS